MTSAVLAAAGYREGPAAPAANARLVIAGTSDLHGFVRSWDYDADRPDPGVGLAKVATLVRELRRHHGGDDRVILLDAGDTIQGTPMMRLAADGRLDGPHPMALAMRELGYSAAALGNHDVEYGFDVLDAFTSGCGFPVLAANTTGPRALGASVLLDVLPQPLPASEPPVAGGSWPTLRLGLIGLTTPGIPVWTKGVVDGLLDVGDLVAAAAMEADLLLTAGADLIVVTAHSGPCPFSSYGRVVPWLENASALVAEQVPGVVAVLAGHAHSDVAEQLIARPDGSVAVLTEPACYGRRLSVIHVDVAFDGSRWRAVGTSAQTLDPHEADEDEVVAAAVEGPHLATRALLAERVGGLSEPVDLSVPPWRPSVALELIARVAGEAAIDGAGLDLLPGIRAVVASVSKVYRDGSLPAGPLTVGGVGSLYRFDNRLVAVRLTGAQLRDYLTWSARYFGSSSNPGTDPVELARRAVPDAPQGLPDYDFDVVVGIACVVTYDVDVAADPDARIRRFAVDGGPVADDDEFAVVLTEYRHNGSRDYPHVRDAEVLWRSEGYLRELIEAHVRRVGVVDVAALRRPTWRLTVGTEALPGTVATAKP